MTKLKKIFIIMQSSGKSVNPDNGFALFCFSKEMEEIKLSKVTSTNKMGTKIIATSFLFAGGNIAIQGIFQALGCGIDSLIISLLRLCIVVLPLAWLFTKLENAYFMIWWAFPIAEFIAFIIAILLLLRENNIIIKPMNEKKA